MSKRQALGVISLNNRPAASGPTNNEATAAPKQHKTTFAKTQSFAGKTTTLTSRQSSFSSSNCVQYKSTTSLARTAVTASVTQQRNDENVKTYAPLQNFKKHTFVKPTTANSEYDFDIFVPSNSQQQRQLAEDLIKPANKENTKPVEQDVQIEQDKDDGVAQLNMVTDTLDMDASKSHMSSSSSSGSSVDGGMLKLCEITNGRYQDDSECMMESPVAFDDTIKFMSKSAASGLVVDDEEDDVCSEVEDEEDEETRKRIESDNILFNLVDYKDDCIQ
jgi:hypothetical protein